MVQKPPVSFQLYLQNLIQNILKHYSIESSFIEGAPGVYVGEKKIASKLFTGKKPPDEINVMARFNEIYDLKSNILSTKNITNVKNE